jgi:hypothetical protein
MISKARRPYYLSRPVEEAGVSIPFASVSYQPLVPTATNDRRDEAQQVDINETV